MSAAREEPLGATDVKKVEAAAAKALGGKVPQAILVRADRVIE